MSKAENVSIPTIHLNGSSAQSLKSDLEGAYRKLGEALEALHETAPHARDYYVQAPGAFTKAQDAYFKRLDYLDTVRNELLAIFEGIDKQVIERTNRAVAQVEPEPVAPEPASTDISTAQMLANIHEAHERRVKANTEKAQQQRLDVLMIEIRESDETEIGRRAARVCREIGLEFSIREFEDLQSDLRGGHRIFVQ